MYVVNVKFNGRFSHTIQIVFASQALAQGWIHSKRPDPAFTYEIECWKVIEKGIDIFAA